MRSKAAFRKDGTVTAGNAPPVNDGARCARRSCPPIARGASERHTDGAHCRSGDKWSRAEVAADDAGRSCPSPC